jgi:hypothetical protein
VWPQKTHFVHPIALLLLLLPSFFLSQDPDMLKVGAGCLSLDQERTQMALWCILAAPLLIGSDLRHMPAESSAILLNTDAIAIDQVRA